MTERPSEEAELPAGGAFLIHEAAPERVFTPEEMSEEHQAIAQTTEEFFRAFVAAEPRPEASDLLRQSADLGLTVVLAPEQLGGMDLDLISAGLVADRLAGDADYALCHCYHSGAGTLPVLWYGSPARQERYLPRIAAGEMVAGHCYGVESAPVTEPAEGGAFTITGQRLRGRNVALADLLSVVARADAERTTVFLVERGAPGVSVDEDGTLTLERVRVEDSGVLGERGGGAEIAARARDIERLLLAHCGAGGGRAVTFELLDAIPAHEVGALARQQLAHAVARAFAADATACRLSGLVRGRMDAGESLPGALRAHSIECSLAAALWWWQLDAVLASAAELRALLGGLPAGRVERGWREARNSEPVSVGKEYCRAARLLIEGARGKSLPLPAAVKALEKELIAGPWPAARNALEAAARVKKATLLCFGAAFRRFGPELVGETVVLAGIGELAALAFAMESAAVRAGKLAGPDTGGPWGDVAALFAQESLARAAAAARGVLVACTGGDRLWNELRMLRRIMEPDAYDEAAGCERVAGYLIEAGQA